MKQNYSNEFNPLHADQSECVPGNYLSLKQWHEEYGLPVFASAKMLHYYTFPVQRELIEVGAMARVGVQIYLHKTRFWPEYQRIIANQMDGGQP